jgi:hypothetical protein
VKSGGTGIIETKSNAMKSSVYGLVLAFLFSGCCCFQKQVPIGLLPGQKIFIPYQDYQKLKFVDRMGDTIKLSTVVKTEITQAFQDYCPAPKYEFLNVNFLKPDSSSFWSIAMGKSYIAFSLDMVGFRIDFGKDGMPECGSDPTIKCFDSLKISQKYYYQVFQINKTSYSYSYDDNMYYNKEFGILQVLRKDTVLYSLVQ